MTIRILLPCLLALASITSVGVAQVGPPGIVGSFEIQDENGNPVTEQGTLGTTITMTGPNTYQSALWLKKPDGTVIPQDETVTIIGLAGTTQYLWFRENGARGTLVWNYAGYYESFSDTSPYRRFVPIPN